MLPVWLNVSLTNIPVGIFEQPRLASHAQTTAIPEGRYGPGIIPKSAFLPSTFGVRYVEITHSFKTRPQRTVSAAAAWFIG